MNVRGGGGLLSMRGGSREVFAPSMGVERAQIDRCKGLGDRELKGRDDAD